MVAETAVQLPDEVGGDGELAPDEVVLLQGAHKVTQGPQLEGALEGTLLLLAADPGGAQAQVAELTGRQVRSLPQTSAAWKPSHGGWPLRKTFSRPSSFRRSSIP